MQLSKLEIKGFKSFGEKTILHFDSNITGVVGPNGCGKSNIVDAIRWVLGEQKTKALRSDKMENVIFNGTKDRRPAQLAEVSISFNNTKNILPTQYSHITITRRYYRSGESEYLLNNIVCRLKDITNLFLDTGIGSDSYAIIELKMVDDILNDRDNSRRTLFEEAAGISKYKVRKKETLRKLEETSLDLDRLADLLFEIEKNMKQLEKQAKQTQKYLDLKQVYKQKSIVLAKAIMQSRSEQKNRILGQIEQQNIEKSQSSAQQAQKQADLEKQKSELIGHEKLLASRQKTLNEHVALLRQTESEMRLAGEKLAFIASRNQLLNGQLQHDLAAQIVLQSDIEALENAINEAENAVEKADKAATNAQSQANYQRETGAAGQSRAARIRVELEQSRQKLFQQTKELDILQIELSNFNKELERKIIEKAKNDTDFKEFENKIVLLDLEINQYKQNLEGLAGQQSQLEQHISDCQARIITIETGLWASERGLDAAQNEYTLTKAIVENLEGYPQAVQFLQKNQHWQALPLLSDVFGCPPEYRVAVEVLLEPYINFYVASSQSEALAAIGLLQSESQGKAAFFVLEKLSFLPSSIPSICPKGCVNVLNIIEFDKEYTHLAAYLFDNVFISQSSDEQQNAQVGTTIISKSGQLCERAVSISGGSANTFEGQRIGRAKNMERLQELITSQTKAVEIHKKDLSAEQNKLHVLKNQNNKQIIDEQTKKLNSSMQEMAVISSRAQQLQIRILDEQNEANQIIEKRAQISEKIENVAQVLIQLDEKTKDIEDQNTQILEQNQENSETLNFLTNQYNQLQLEFVSMQGRLQNADQKLSFKNQNQEQLLAKIIQNQQEIEKNEAQMLGLQDLQIDTDVLAEQQEQKIRLEQALRQIEQQYYSARSEIDILEKSLGDGQRKRENIEQVLAQYQEKLSQAKIELASVSERLSVEFEIEMTTETLDEQPTEPLDEQWLSTEIKELRAQIDKLGPVNYVAMESYNEIKERYDFMIAQKKDLEQARASLDQTIDEIEKVAKEAFMSAFGRIRENFIEVFRTLFTQEDTCDLILSQPDNALESDIDIIARPKGKRPLTINQLSGGEKTLTAISLLFAIYLIKPAPFCIFDEVDAPLDDANIDKFNQIIRKFSDQSQFIIVTHNKRTMAATDIIYGVTMLEAGISRLIPVDLRALA